MVAVEVFVQSIYFIFNVLYKLLHSLYTMVYF